MWDDYITKHKNLMYLEGQLQEQEDQQQQQLKDTLVRANGVLVTIIIFGLIKIQV